MIIQHTLDVDSDIRRIGINIGDKLPGVEIKTGDYTPALLEYRMEQHPELSLMVKFVPFSDADSITSDPNPAKIYWADASGITMLKVTDGAGGWGSPFEALGILVRNGKKLAKRLKEIARLSRYHSITQPVVKFFETTDETEKYYDGISVMRRSFADLMGVPKHVKRGNYRGLGPAGLIKGDVIIISDKQMMETHGDYDIVSPTVNLKDEVRTTGGDNKPPWYFNTLEPHHAHNQAMFDIQSSSWLREWLYPRDLVKDTLTNVVDAALTNLKEGKWPSWMILPEQDGHGEGTDALPDMVKASVQYHAQHLRWQMFGMQAEQSASIMGQAANLFAAKIQSKLDYRDAEGAWKPKMWYPLPHAVYGHITTHQVLELAGYTIPEGCEDKLFFHKESASFSLPGDQFADTFEAHGTWDLDDSAKFFLRKVEGEDRVVAIIVRSPNSDGEYSIHKVGNISEFPLYHQYGEMPEVNLGSDVPKRIEMVMDSQVVVGLPEDTRVADPNFTEEEARYSIEVQVTNPGVGPTANAMMVYYAAKQGSPLRVTDTMGNIVDCVQQTPYKEGFKAIKAFNNQLWKELCAYGQVDSYLLRTRVPKSMKSEFRSYDGFFAGLLTHMQNELKRFREESRIIAFSNRQANLIPAIKARTFSQDVLTLAGRWVAHYEKSVEDIVADKSLRGNDRISKQKRSLAYQKVMRDMVTALDSMDTTSAHELCMAIYRVVTTPGHEAKYKFGRSDRILFAPAAPGERSTMDIFIGALVSIGVAQPSDAVWAAIAAEAAEDVAGRSL